MTPNIELTVCLFLSVLLLRVPQIVIFDIKGTTKKFFSPKGCHEILKVEKHCPIVSFRGTEPLE